MVDLTTPFDRDRSLEACHQCLSSTPGKSFLKIKEDLARYEQVIAETKPEILVECGTLNGYSARWFSHIVPHVVTVDVNDYSLCELPGNVTVIRGGSVADETFAKVIPHTANHRVMVVLDSDHSSAHVEMEINRYGPLVTPGCYLVVEDGILRWLPSHYVGNPLDAIEKVLVGKPGWAEQPDGPVTLFHRGWWLRTGDAK